MASLVNLFNVKRLGQLQTTLLQAARNDLPSERVPYAFEKRIMSLLPAAVPADGLAEWTAAFWRAAVSSLGVALVVGAVNVSIPSPESGDAMEIATADMESVPAISAESPSEVW